MSCLGNIIWLLLGGVWMGLTWWFAGQLCFLSIVGIPWGRACFVIGQFAFFPFGKMPVSREVLIGQCAITIIGIPFALQHVKLAALALCPIGMTIVPVDVADAAERSAAHERLRPYRP